MASRRVADLPLGSNRLYERMSGSRFVLLDTSGVREAAEPWRDRVDAIHADGPILHGNATTLLIRPDGYLAWTATHPDGPQLREALHHWCGAA
ncbi:aromatic-ring hydroxylase C-terminal domain-containing protein [Nonomuraea turcica]|uniref:aromatic-ring hydroxylase C-terminal domain-containing protein n=1 Tax=Nonomuraea sp. G32 TaxID=3067274 RepID=UPI00273C2044|nr:hypothetical protein [Nonomuraea sp. G32]MDP4505331.1 hypothetical protein [Nonomuraea sp. G32]